jgi:hypothetical protein
MRVFHELINRVRSWRAWTMLLLRRPARHPVLPAAMSTMRPILREVTRQGVRVYSLCFSCGAHLSASATLCDTCARARARRTPRP